MKRRIIVAVSVGLACLGAALYVVLNAPGEKWFIVLAAIILIGAIIGVSYAIIARPGDRGFMHRANIDLDEVPLKWNLKWKPFSVIVDKEVPQHVFEKVVRAVTRINDIADKEPIFLYPIRSELHVKPKCDEVPKGVIYVINVETDMLIPDGWTHLNYDNKSGKIYSCMVALRKDLSNRAMVSAALHEFGHALGLDHDDEKTSVMYPSLVNENLSYRDMRIIRRYYD